MNDETTQTPREAVIAHRTTILEMIPRPKFQKVSAELMVLSKRINPAEGVSKTWVDHYTQYWSDALVDPMRVLKLGEEEYEIIDGRHRWLAAKARGLETYKFLCLVHEGLSEKEVAALFQYFNQIRRTVSEKEKQTVAALHGDPVAVIVANVLNDVPYKLGCFGTMRQIVERSHDLDEGETALRWALQTIADSFPAEDDRHRFIARIVKPFGLFFIKYRQHENFDPSDLHTRLYADRKTSRQLAHEGEEFGGNEGSAAYIVRRLAQLHDKGRRRSKRLEP